MADPADFQLVLGERLDLRKDWAADLTQLAGGTPDTVTASTWTSLDGLTVDDDPAPTFDATTATVWVTGGALFRVYRLENTVTTAAGRVFVDTLTVQVVRRRSR